MIIITKIDELMSLMHKNHLIIVLLLLFIIIYIKNINIQNINLIYTINTKHGHLLTMTDYLSWVSPFQVIYVRNYSYSSLYIIVQMCQFIDLNSSSRKLLCKIIQKYICIILIIIKLTKICI